jgi:outer membrane immunogenic protein
MKSLILAATLSVLGSGVVIAADLPFYSKTPAAPLPAVSNWTGFYIGGTLGGAWNNNSVDVATTNTFINTPVLTPFGQTPGPASAAAATGNIGTKRSALAGGVEGGYNWQLAPNWVVGIEADFESFGGSSGSGQVTQVAPRSGFPGYNYTATLSASDKIGWLGTVRGRLGFLITPTWLVYGTGGLAYGNASSATAITGAETPYTGTNGIAGAGTYSSTRTGWTAGAGMEYLFATNWTVKAEWLHYDLGTATYSNGTMSGLQAQINMTNFTDVSSSTVKFSGDIVRAGVNYKF